MKVLNVKTVLALGTVALALGAVAPASAGLVKSVAALAPTDSFDWGQLGAEYTDVSSPAPIISAGGLAASVTSAGGTFERRNEGSSWSGNFALGDHLLWDHFVGPDITINFATPVAGAGAYVMADYYGAFTAQIALSNGEVRTEAGNSNGNNDGSAIFIGALDASADITSISFTLPAAFQYPQDFAIDTLFVRTTGTGVPEPITLSLFGVGLAGLGFARRRRQV
jgi:hypothetical protein